MKPWKSLNNYIEWIDSKLFECLPMPFEIEFKSLSDFTYFETLKNKNDPKINLYDDFYKPNRLTAFHEIFYFNNLNTNRISNNLPSQGFTGNIMAILDPFKFKKKSFSGLSSNVKNQNPESMLLNSSSDDDFTDDSSSFIPDFSLKTNNSEKLKPLNLSSPEKKEKSIFEISDQSLDIYKKYAQDAQRIEVTYKKLIDKKYYKFFINDEFCEDPLKSITKKNMSIYESHLNGENSNNHNIFQIKSKDLILYEKFINSRENLQINKERLDLKGFENFKNKSNNEKISFGLV